MRKISRIVIHHSEGDKDNFESIKRFHTTPKPNGRGWRHVAYHVVIENTGRTFIGVGEDFMAGGCDHESGASPTSLEVCLCGDLNKHMPTSHAFSSLTNLVVQWSKKYQISPDRIVGHKDVQPFKHDPTRSNSCPGNMLYPHLNELRARVKAAL